MTTFILRRTEDAQFKQPTTEEALALAKSRAISYESHLTRLGIDVKDYNEVYEIAVQVHVDTNPNGPFGIDDIVAGAKKFLGKNSTTPKTFSVVKKEKSECVTCSGTGLKFNTQGKIVYEKIKGKKKAVKCPDC